MDTPPKWGQIGLIVLVTLAVFAAVALGLYFAIPGAHGPTDYLAIGTAATFAAMLTLFLFLTRTMAKGIGLFYKRKRRRSESTEPRS